MWHLPADQTCPHKRAVNDLPDSKPALANCHKWLLWVWWQPLSDCSRPLPRLHWDKTIELSVVSPLDWTAQANLCRPWNSYHVHLWQWSQLCLCGIYWLYSRLGHPTCHLQSPSRKGEWLGWISSQDNEVHYQQSQQTGTDVWNAILEWRNSPTPSQGSFPVQRLMSCWTRSFLLCQESLYKPEVQSAVTAQVMRKTQPTKHYHVQSAKQLPSLVIGQPVWVKAYPEQPHSDWKSGVILQNIAPCSYLVEVNGCTYRRNRVHLRDAVQSQTGSLPVKYLTWLRPQVCLRANVLTMIMTRLAISHYSGKSQQHPCRAIHLQLAATWLRPDLDELSSPTTCLRTLFSERFKYRTDLSS